MAQNIVKLSEKRSEIEKNTSTAAKRLSMLFDADTFVEINPFMTSHPELTSDGLVCGYGTVNGSPVFAYAQEPSVLGGAFGRVQGEKIKAVYKKACRMGVPVIAVLDSKGVRLDEGMESFSVLGEIYNELSASSGVIPQISIVSGSAMGSMAVIPALSDFSLALESSKVFMFSPETKENKASEGSLINKRFETEEEMFAFARKLLSFLPANNAGAGFSEFSGETYISELNENVYSASDLCGLISDNNDFAQTCSDDCLTIGFSRFGGQCAAVIAFSGKEADGKSLSKAAEFVSFADAFAIPVVTLTNLAGYSTEDDEADLMKGISKITSAFSKATVPKINIITEKLIGAPLLSINSKMTGADMVYVWATAETGLMSSEAAVNVMDADSFKNAGDIEALKMKKLSEYRESKLDPFELAKTGLADDIIEPAETRAAIISALRLLYTKAEAAKPYRKHSAKEI
ncbi:MAG: hypothetical protein IKD83_08530 [Firmicutes bacterium]|nr:hypothetical protein [Bacillota bacterium]